MADHFVKKPRKSNFSPEEIEALIKTVNKYHSVLFGEFAKRATNKNKRESVWFDITKQVNKVSLEKRTLQEVKNKWKKCQHLYKDQDLSDEFDSMPLEQRLTQVNPDQEAVLQSQPLSPTKLKVTRQAAKPSQPSPKLQSSTPDPPEEVCLRWNSHHYNMQTTFPNILMKEQYVDATLVAEGQTLKCHRLILSSCSPYFEEILSSIGPFQHPVLFMKDIPFWILKCLCDYMYAGEVHIYQNKLEDLLTVAENLKIKGLAGKKETENDEKKPIAMAQKSVKLTEDSTRELRDRKRLSTTQMDLPKGRTPQKPHYRLKRSAVLEKELKSDIVDPLELMQPVYEEVTKENKSISVPIKLWEVKSIPIKRNLPKKKRKLSNEREESPPPLFLSRKGTRSRPNVKIPKYYHSDFDRLSKETAESTIVREPHTDQADPLLQVDEIKAEPVDVEDDVIEIENNTIDFTDQELSVNEEEIIGDYDSPIVNIAKEKKDQECCFRKINLQQPIILDVRSLGEKNALEVGNLKTNKNDSEKAPEMTKDKTSFDFSASVENTENSDKCLLECELTKKKGDSLEEIEYKKKKSVEKDVEHFGLQNNTGEKECPLNKKIKKIKEQNQDYPTAKSDAEKFSALNLEPLGFQIGCVLSGKDCFQEGCCETSEDNKIKDLGEGKAVNPFDRNHQKEQICLNETFGETIGKGEQHFKVSGIKEGNINESPWKKPVDDDKNNIKDKNNSQSEKETNKKEERTLSNNEKTSQNEEEILSKKKEKLSKCENSSKKDIFVEKEEKSFVENTLHTAEEKVTETEDNPLKGKENSSKEETPLKNDENLVSLQENNEKLIKDKKNTLLNNKDDSLQKNNDKENFEQMDAKIDLTELKSKKKLGDREIPMTEFMEETQEFNDVDRELGFHIAQVASEQFSMKTDKKEDEGLTTCSTIVENLKEASCTDLDAIVKNLSEMVEESQKTESMIVEPSETTPLIDKAKFLSENLDEFLD